MFIVAQKTDRTDWEYGPELAPRHARMLRQSAVHPVIAAERGYRTVEDVAELLALGFAPYQAGPGLLVPIHTIGSDRIVHQLRRDAPRANKKGKRIKYETPRGQRLTLDAPHRVHDRLRDPRVELWVTEGSKKVDSIISNGHVAIGLMGVWGFRGTNAVGGKTVLTAWDEIALNGRTVYLAFDSDIVTKPSVFQALRALKTFLEFRGADVWIMNLAQEVAS